MHVKTTSAFNVNYKIAVACIKYIDSFIKCSGESYKWNIRMRTCVHFKVCTTSTRTWSQTVAPLVSRSIDNALVEVKPILHQASSQIVDALNHFIHASLYNTTNK